MNTLQIPTEAMKLPENERASLAADLLDSLPEVLADEDDGSAEARRRIEEMKSDPSVRRTWEEIRAEVGR